MKSVLLPIQNDAGFEPRLQAALAIVRANSGHLSCRHITPLYNFVGYEGFGGTLLMAQFVNTIDEEARALRERVEARLMHEDVSWDYDQLSGNAGGCLAAQARLTDLIVVSRPDHVGVAPGALPAALAMFGDLLHAAQRPLLVMPESCASFDPFGPVVIGWNGSLEAANALRQALPLIKSATSVHLVTVDEPEFSEFPAEAAAEYLARHDIICEIRNLVSGDAAIDSLLRAQVEALTATCLIVGAYGHSRAREYLFGGATRALLEHCPVPLLLAH